jgi:glycosyltransferase involved in cell wall biosynthesis
LSKFLPPLVSIVSPCFNGEDYIERFLDSVLNQSYRNIELIVVDDASTDSTLKVLETYIEKFKASGLHFKIISQKQNSGQADAINQGLKSFSGKYLMWPDSDDILTKDSILERVSHMEKNNVDFIRTDINVVTESNVDKVLYKMSDVNDFKNIKIFSDLLFEKNVYFCPGGYMVTRNALINSIPSLHIYPSRFGQNWQLLLAISAKYDCHYLNRCHYKYVVRGGSHSREGGNDLQKKIAICDGHKDILFNSVKRYSVLPKEQDSLLSRIEDKYERKKMHIYIEAYAPLMACRHFQLIKHKIFEDYMYIGVSKAKLYSFAKKAKKLIWGGNEKLH